MAIEYNFSGKWDDYKALLRKFSLDSILRYANAVSTKLCFGDGTKHSHTMVSIPIMAKGSGLWEKKPVLLTTWSLIDLAYNAVKATNDFHGRKLEYEEEFYVLCAANTNYLQTEERITINPIKKSPEFLFYVWGFSGEQFRMQNPSYIFDNAARELYMLFELSKKDGELSIEQIIQNRTGMDWREITASVLLVWLCFSRAFDIRRIERIVKWDDQFRLENYRRVIEYYSTNYKEVRESALGRQIFYTKPYIQTQKGELLSINCYLNLCLYEHCILWIIRDYFMEQGSQEFNIYFGELFEEYLSELFSYCLKEEQYEKIERVKNKKRADWKMEALGYKFLIEQKSSILRLSAKQQESDYRATIDYSSKNVIKALRQLEATEQDFADGEYIKIVLLYEDYLPPSIIDLVFALEECEVENDGRYWLMTIDEMERFLYTYKTNPSLFQKIVAERAGNNETNGKRSIGSLLSENGIDRNQYLEQEKLEHYKNITQEFLRAHLVYSGPENGIS